MRETKKEREERSCMANGPGLDQDEKMTYASVLRLFPKNGVSAWKQHS